MRPLWVVTLLLVVTTAGCAADTSTDGVRTETYDLSTPTTLEPVADGTRTAVTIRHLELDHGDGTIVLAGGESMLIDTGKAAGGGAVLDALEANGVDSLDVLLTTSVEDGDIGGAGAVVRRHDPVGIGQTGVTTESAAYHRYLRAVVETAQTRAFYESRSSTRFPLGPARVNVLTPPETLLANGTPSENAMVVELRAEGERYIYLGDAGAAEQAWLVETYDDLNASVVALDSGTRLSTALRDAIAPRAVIVSGPQPSGSGPPAEPADIPTYHTANGTVVVTLGPDGITVDQSIR
jgi:beta-lactamase superfamily II metal-dependent hydrolase